MKTQIIGILIVALAFVGCSSTEAQTSSAGASSDSAESSPSTGEQVDPADVERVSVQEARQRVRAGQALLVCAYDSEERFQQVALDGAISLATFEQRFSELPRDQEVIFYCG